MAIRATPIFKQAIRFYNNRTHAQPQDQMGSAATIAYWCAVVSAPLGGAWVISQAATTDKRFSSRRSLGLRDGLPESSLDEYAGAFMHLRR